MRGTAGPGLWIEANATVQVDRSRIEGNGGTGIRAWSPGGRLTVSDSLVSSNQGVGVHASSFGLGTWEVTVTRTTVDGNAVTGIVVGSGANGTYRVAVTDNVVRRNSSEGVSLFANPGETVTALVGNNRIMGNLNGISCGGGGTSALVAERNEVVGNLRAFDGAGGCTFESLGNNAARRNTEPDIGTITTVPLR